MIKPLNSTQLASAKPRCGLQKISELLPRLIRQYEIQAEMVKRREEIANSQAAIQAASTPVATAPTTPPAPTASTHATVDMACQQATFGWYE